jgi:hypothetical protein
MTLLSMVTCLLATRTVPALVLGVFQLKVHQEDVISSVCMIIWAFPKVHCSQNGMVIVITAPPDLSGCANDCEMVDLSSADCARMMATAVLNQGIFAHDFSEEWTEAELESQACTVVIDHIIQLCDFLSGSVMVKCDQ